MGLNVIRLPEAKRKTGLSRSTIYIKIAAGEFPKPVQLGSRAVGFLEHELDRWIEDRVVASRSKAGATQPGRGAK